MPRSPLVCGGGVGGLGGASTTYDNFDTCGIGISIGDGDQITGNSIVDDQAVPTTWYGIHIGARKAQTTPTNTVLTDPPNTATGVIGSLNRYGAFAPQLPTALVASGRTTLAWNESYPLMGLPIAGYRVYRDGHPVANLLVGSATVPANLLSDAETGFETDIAGWTAGSRTTLNRNSGAGAIGTASLALTSTGSGQISTYSRKLPVTASATYTSVASFQAGSTPRRIRAGLAFTTASGAVSRLGSANNATVDATTDWTTSYYTAQAPAGAVDVQVFLMVENTVAGEAHLLDRVGLVIGSSTEQWTDPTAPAGSAIYQVVAYRAGDGENSTVTTLIVA
ncbi:hypothetical protein FKR81_00215 [Lentzea tibetensis]|uniref:Uncharacterized protein n=1 Tax=Lentzea tibetensis TaxID=2591470 RepID=A0A563F3V0_9PSEU|nr:hypothetical protein [Lentzea tibetensis]TWP54034.1 hypothetical protein FKR81_00215 [Lentzea tibetensis]